MAFRHSSRCLLTGLTVLAAAGMPGCVRRTISITSDPDGALVILNHREIGRTPVEVEFLYYGSYDVRLMKDGYEPLIARADADPPLWDSVPFDLVAEAVPDNHHRIEWHYQLEPVVEDPAALLDRAGQLREQLSEDTVERSGDLAEPAANGGETPPAAKPPDRP